jgi:hypothetical protein
MNVSPLPSNNLDRIHTYWIIPAASGATVPKVCTWAMTSSDISTSPCVWLTSPLLFLFCGNLHLGLVQVEVGLHLLDGSFRDGQAKLLWD